MGADRKIPFPSDINERYLNNELRHQVGLSRFSQGYKRQFDEMFQKADREFATWLRAKLPTLTPNSPKRNQKFLTQMFDKRSRIFKRWSRMAKEQLKQFALKEADFERRILQESIPIRGVRAKMPTRSAINKFLRQPYQGRTFNEWVASGQRSDILRLRDIVRNGVKEGASVDSMMAEIVGTKADRFTKGSLATTRRQVAANNQTSLNHTVSSAREALWEANPDMVRAERWTSTLDTKTTAICRSRDGKLTPINGKKLRRGEKRLVPPGARPPAHVNCRSIMTGLLDGEGIVGNRKVVTLKDGTKVDFRQLAKQQGTTVARARSRWINKNFGNNPDVMTYQDWLKAQPAALQDEVLGQRKGKLFRDGGLTVDSFADRAGNELTLKQLSLRRPEAFDKAGLK